MILEMAGTKYNFLRWVSNMEIHSIVEYAF